MMAGMKMNAKESQQQKPAADQNSYAGCEDVEHQQQQ